MKKCVYCGLENADDAVICATCHTEFVATPGGLPVALRNAYMISPEEWRFWNRMTFRQLAVLLVRLAALWCFFEAALESTNFITYMMFLPYLMSRPSGTVFSVPLASQFAAPIVRVGLCIVAGITLFFSAEKVLSWLVRGAVQRQPPEIAPVKSPSTPPA
jgi:hypothetical protein